MGKPITTTDATFICFAFPDVCWTPPTTLATPHGVPIPYPNVGKCGDAVQVSGQIGNLVRAGGNAVITKASNIPTSSGDEAGSLGGVTSGTVKGKVEFTSASNTVRANGKFVVRFGDTTTQNSQNASGIVLGGVPTVLVGD